jgi:two-component sensor histidine kinase
VQGPAFLVSARKAQTLALVIHELATNAAKYGALSVWTGHVEVTWANANDTFSLKWSEMGGPPAQPLAKSGFGSVIITSMVGSELNCEPTLEYRESGFEYRLECSLSALTAA